MMKFRTFFKTTVGMRPQSETGGSKKQASDPKPAAPATTTEPAPK